MRSKRTGSTPQSASWSASSGQAGPQDALALQGQTAKAQIEQITSGLPSKADLRRTGCISVKVRHLWGIVFFAFPVAPIMARLPATLHRVEG